MAAQQHDVEFDTPEAEVVYLRGRVAELDGHLATVVDLRDRVATLIDKVTGPAPLADVRQAMNDVGIHDARRQLTVDAVDAVDHALTDLRTKQDAERLARETYDEALTEATWALGEHFATRSNKQWLAKDADGTPIAEEQQRSYDAAARKEWLEYHAARTQAVRLAKRDLRDAEENTQQSRDALTVAEKRFTAARHSLDAAAAQLHALVRATPREDLR
jgi:hypothetical protein